MHLLSSIAGRWGVSRIANWGQTVTQPVQLRQVSVIAMLGPTAGLLLICWTDVREMISPPTAVAAPSLRTRLRLSSGRCLSCFVFKTGFPGRKAFVQSFYGIAAVVP